MASAIFKRTSYVGRTDPYIQITPNNILAATLNKGLEGIAPVEVSGSVLTDPYVKDATARIAKYTEFTNFYAGRHSEYEMEGGVRKPVCNYPRRIINKRASWVAGRAGFQFVARKGNEAVCEVLDKIWKQNSKKLLIKRTAKVALTTGDAFWYVTIKTKDSKGKELPKEKYVVRICPINPAFVFPIFCEDDPQKMKACMIQFPIWGQGANQTKLFTAVYWDDKYEMYEDLVLTSSGPNLLGRIPIVHISNGSYSDMPFGISALADVINPMRKYNELLMQLGRIVQYHADPTTIVYGTSVSRMEKAAGRVWSNLPPPDQARVENLEMKGDLKAMYGLVELYRDEIHVAGCTPQIAFEARNLATSNSSGLAIQLLFQPLIEVTDDAHDEFDEAIREVNELIAIILKEIKGTPLEMEADSPEDVLEYDLKWPSMLPRDLTQEVDATSKMLEMGIISKAEAARRLTDLTDTERAALEIAADKAEEIAINAEQTRALNGGKPNFSAVAIGSMFVNEDLLDIAGKLGEGIDDSGETA